MLVCVPQNRIAVMVVVSGWMDEAEDDKRTMGVVPSEMGLKVCMYTCTY